MAARFLHVDNTTMIAMDAIRLVEFAPALKAGMDEDGEQNHPRPARLIIWTDVIEAEGGREDGLGGFGCSRTIVLVGPHAVRLYDLIWQM